MLKAEAIRRELRRAEGEAYRIVLTPPGTQQRIDKPLLLKVLGITAAGWRAARSRGRVMGLWSGSAITPRRHPFNDW